MGLFGSEKMVVMASVNRQVCFVLVGRERIDDTLVAMVDICSHGGVIGLAMMAAGL